MYVGRRRYKVVGTVVTDYEAEYVRRLMPVLRTAERIRACGRCGAEALERRVLRDWSRAAVLLHCPTCGTERYVHEEQCQ